jgi:hypothetical protein
VERLGNDPLAGSAFAGDEDVGVGGSDPPDHLQDGLHRGRFRDE